MATTLIPEPRSDLIHLRLVQVGYRLQISSAVPILHEETQIVLQQVGGACDGVLPAIRIVVLHHLTDALFEIRGRDDAEVGVSGEAHLNDAALGRLDYHGEHRVPGTIRRMRKNDLTSPTGSVLWNDSTNCIVTTAVTTRG